ncbi:MAG: adenine phosphoribosyltransferase [Myxococcales bacterium]|nr:adenine phosphoribosyltransferase [Myxococcales bacterium]
MTDERYDLVREHIRDVPDFPKPGVLFKDITPILADPTAYRIAVRLLEERCDLDEVDIVAGVESRGFIFGAALAATCGCGFVPIRKPGKLPAAVHRIEYSLEYGTDALEIHRDAIKAGSRVLIVDDIIATGGTARAAAELVEKAGGEVAGLAFVIHLTFLDGLSKLTRWPVVTLIDV